MPVNDRSEHKLVGQSKVAPEQQTIGRVKRLFAVFVRTNYHVLQIPEVGVEVV